jgi:hypothetical protein
MLTLTEICFLFNCHANCYTRMYEPNDRWISLCRLILCLRLLCLVDLTDMRKQIADNATVIFTSVVLSCPPPRASPFPSTSKKASLRVNMMSKMAKKKTWNLLESQMMIFLYRQPRRVDESSRIVFEGYCLPSDPLVLPELPKERLTRRTSNRPRTQLKSFTLTWK